MSNRYRLMVPGPTTAPPEVLAAGALPVFDERIPRFAVLFNRVLNNLAAMMATESDVLLFAASITGACESALQNLFSPGERILIGNNGFFAQRWVDMARAYGLDVVELACAWGSPVDASQVERALALDPSIRAAVCVHCETSTGALTDVAAFGAATRDVISIVDAASSLGVSELRTDEWGIDVVVSGGHKALMIPPGTSFVSVSPRAWAAHRDATMPRFYFDWTAAKEAVCVRGATPWTAPVGLIVQLDLAVRQILDEGVAEVVARHNLLSLATRAGLQALGLELLVEDKYASGAVTAAWTPPGLDGAMLVRVLLDDYGVQVTGGLAEQAGRLLRIGHCGYVDGLDIVATVAAVEQALLAHGHPVVLGAGVAATQRILTESGARQ